MAAEALGCEESIERSEMASMDLRAMDARARLWLADDAADGGREMVYPAWSAVTD